MDRYYGGVTEIAAVVRQCMVFGSEALDDGALSKVYQCVTKGLEVELASRPLERGTRFKSCLFKFVKASLPRSCVEDAVSAVLKSGAQSGSADIAKHLRLRLLRRITGLKAWKSLQRNVASLAADRTRKAIDAFKPACKAISWLDTCGRLSPQTATTLGPEHFAAMLLLIREGLCGGGASPLGKAARLAHALPAEACGGRRRFVRHVALALCAGGAVGCDVRMPELNELVKGLIKLGTKIAKHEGAAVKSAETWGTVMMGLFALGMSPASLGAAHPLGRFIVGLLDVKALTVSEHMPPSRSSDMRDWAEQCARALGALVILEGDTEGTPKTHAYRAVKRLVLEGTGAPCGTRVDAARRLGFWAATDSEWFATALQGDDPSCAGWKPLDRAIDSVSRDPRSCAGCPAHRSPSQKAWDAASAAFYEGSRGPTIWASWFRPIRVGELLQGKEDGGVHAWPYVGDDECAACLCMSHPAVRRARVVEKAREDWEGAPQPGDAIRILKL